MQMCYRRAGKIPRFAVRQEEASMSLAGKNAVVTGGASGIGRGIALRLAREGANVAILDLNLAGAENVAAEIAALGRQSVAYQTDVAKRAQVQASIDRVRQNL